MNKDIKNYVEKFEQLMPGFIKVFHSPSAALEEIDITISQCIVLQNLSLNDNCKMSDLSEALGVTLSNITGMLDRLEKEGLARRLADTEDRRIVRVRLTPKGKNIIKKINEKKRINLSAILGKLSSDDRASLLAIMQKLAGKE